MKIRFSIRDLLWLALVVALGSGWWLDHQNLVPFRIEHVEREELRLRNQINYGPLADKVRKQSPALSD
jgi:hypothetical protein